MLIIAHTVTTTAGKEMYSTLIISISTDNAVAHFIHNAILI